MSRSRLARLLLCAALGAPAAAAAQSRDAAPLEGAFVFGRFGSIWQQRADLAEPAVEIAELPDDAAEIRWMEAIRDGRLVILDMVERPVWLFAPDPAGPATVMSNVYCSAEARPNPWGGCLVCQHSGGRPVLVASGRMDQAALPGPLADVGFLGTSGLDMVARAGDTIVGFDRRKPAERRVLAQNGATSHLLVSPDGTRAVAIFGEGDAGRIRSFLLDGKGVSRQLGGPGIPTLWSWDSTWVLYQEGDTSSFDDDSGDGGDALGDAEQRSLAAAPQRRPDRPRGPPVRACVARAVGGEVKCWTHYTGVAFSPDSTLVLLQRDRALYVGRIAGVRAETPKKVVEDVDGAATWVPGLIAAPLPPPTPSR